MKGGGGGDSTKFPAVPNLIPYAFSLLSSNMSRRFKSDTMTAINRVLLDGQILFDIL